jgi:hypothetical protein
MGRMGTRTLLLAAAVALAGGCAPAPAEPPNRARPATCPPSMPDRGGPAQDDGSGADLVPAEPEPVALTLCVHPIDLAVDPDGVPAGTPQPPVSVVQTDDALRATLVELRGLPPATDTEDRACNAAMWPGYLLLVEHRDGTVTTLVVDRSCGLVSNGAGAVRAGLPAVVAEQ